MFLKKPTPKYKHLYAKPTKLGWISHSSIMVKLMFILIVLLIAAVGWLGGTTIKWKAQKVKYKQRISLLRQENEALRVEKDLMITRMTIAGLLKPVKDGVYEFNDQDLTYYTENNGDDDVGYSEMVSFSNFGGSYNPRNGQLKITFKINNVDDSGERIEGRVFVVLGGEDMTAAEYKLLPNDSEIMADGRPDGSTGGAGFSMLEFKDMTFNGVVESADSVKYDAGMIYVFTKEGILVQIWPLELDLSKTNNIVVTEVESE